MTDNLNTSILPEEERKMARPREVVARALDPSIWKRWDDWIVFKGFTTSEAAAEMKRAPDMRDSLAQADAAMLALRKRGFLTTDALIAIRAETDEAGK